MEAYQAKDLLNSLQKKIYGFCLDLSRENRKGELSCAFVYARLDAIRSDANDIGELLGVYFSKDPKLAGIFRILLSDINEKCEYYRVKSREAETSLTPPEFEDLQYIPETWISRIERIISYLAPSKTVNINIIDSKNQQYPLSLTLNEGMGDAVSRTLRHMPKHVVYRIGERRLGPRYSRKSLFELDIEPGSTIRVESAVGELIPNKTFDRPIILRGGQTINVGGTFIIGRIWGERLGIRMFPRDMYVGQLMDEIQGDVEKTFSADTRGWIKDKCPRYVSRVHAVIYQKDSVFYFLDVSLNGTLLISDGEEKDIRSGRDEFNETGQITPYQLSSNNTVKLFGTSFDIIIKSY